MPRYTLDLHNHTPLIPSDYRGDPATTPRQIVETALERGIDVWGIADHFSVEWGPLVVAAAAQVAAETGQHLLVIPGAEVRVRFQGEETHLVCLFPPDSVEECFDTLLAELGLSSPVAPLDELPYFGVEIDPTEVGRMVHELGGLCHIGHVDRVFGEYSFIESELVHRLAECHYISAIELVDHGSKTRFRDGLAIAYISSSDSHSLAEMGRRTAVLEMPELSFEGLREGLRALQATSRPAGPSGLRAEARRVPDVP